MPSIQKDFRLRNRDIAELQSLAPKYLAGLAGEYWKFRMPLSLQDAAHFIDNQWKARMSLSCSAIESIFSSQTQDHEHSGGRLVKARIKWFLGENTSIYAPGDVPSFVLRGKEPTIGNVLDDLYDVRNFLAHGDRVPDKYFSQFSHSAGYTTTETNQLAVLEEAASFIVRASLIKMLQDDLLENFKGGPESQAYFTKYGLVNSRLATSNP